ncbi:MAG: DUF3309 family protein [Deltaproteobacteria bacterium]|nr:MAG: DUF3309 family protein [Deltaproteobacteria bacterium]
MMGLVLLIVLLVIVLGGLPTWGYHDYGYGPSGIGGVLLLVILILLLTGRL